MFALLKETFDDNGQPVWAFTYGPYTDRAMARRELDAKLAHEAKNPTILEQGHTLRMTLVSLVREDTRSIVLDTDTPGDSLPLLVTDNEGNTVKHVDGPTDEQYAEIDRHNGPIRYQTGEASCLTCGSHHYRYGCECSL